MKEEAFRIPGSSYDELIKIIKGYGTTDKELSLSRLSTMTGMGPTVVSRNNGFLLDTGIIEGTTKKKITEAGKKLAQALAYDLDGDISKYWRQVIGEIDFLHNLVSSVQIRKGMEPSTLRTHVAYSAGKSRGPTVMTGAGAIIEILKKAGLVVESDGQLVVATDIPRDHEGDKPLSTSDKSEKEQPTEEGKIFSGVTVVDRAVPGGSIAVTIQLQIQCDANEIEELGPKIRQLINEVLKQDEPDIDNHSE